MIHWDQKIVVIAGPTASGKSDIALKIAKEINGYIINADSRQIYKELNIGTAKPRPDSILKDGTWVIDGVNHYLYDIVDPRTSFTIYEYQNEVNKVLEKNRGTNQIPILVGGTGLYIDSVIFNYELSPNNNTDSDLTTLSLPQLQELAKEFISAMNNSDINNKHRLIRAIQRKGISNKQGKTLKHIYFVIDVDKEILKERINNRVIKMFDLGLEEENRNLLSQGYTYNDRALKSIGYQELNEYFEGKIPIEKVKDLIITHTLQYAKRQRTWFKRNKQAIWTNDYQSIMDLLSNFISTE